MGVSYKLYNFHFGVEYPFKSYFLLKFLRSLRLSLSCVWEITFVTVRPYIFKQRHTCLWCSVFVIIMTNMLEKISGIGTWQLHIKPPSRHNELKARQVWVSLENLIMNRRWILCNYRCGTHERLITQSYWIWLNYLAERCENMAAFQECLVKKNPHFDRYHVCDCGVNISQKAKQAWTVGLWECEGVYEHSVPPRQTMQ